MFPAKAHTWTAWSGVQHINHEATMPPQGSIYTVGNTKLLAEGSQS